MITIYNSAFRFKRNLVRQVSLTIKPSKRGLVHGFSSKSSTRLKDLILSIDTHLFFAFTLTFPFFEGFESFDYVEFMRVFKQSLYRLIQQPFIWRLELQQNTRPHYHCLIPFYNDSQYNFSDLQFRIKSCWKRALRNNNINYMTDKYLTNFQIVSSSQGLNYLVLHTSKHKILQLPANGRCWGVIAKNVLRKKNLDFNLPLFLENRINRTFRKYLKKYFNKSSKYSSFFIIKYSSVYKKILTNYCAKYFPVGFFDSFF